MKYLILLILLLGCSRKYQTYQVIDKREFNYPGENKPINKTVLQGRQDSQKSCEGQWLFMRNAQKINEGNVRALVQYSCPKSNYLVNTTITEIWWTTIVYSRSCINLVTFCPKN